MQSSCCDMRTGFAHPVYASPWSCDFGMRHLACGVSSGASSMSPGQGHRRSSNTLLTTTAWVNLVDNEFPQKSCLFDIVHKMLARHQTAVDKETDAVGMETS